MSSVAATLRVDSVGAVGLSSAARASALAAVLEAARGAAARARWPGLLPRLWRAADSDKGATGFRVLQFNTLADGLSGEPSDFGGFSEVDRRVLDFEVRKWRLLEAIAVHAAGAGDGVVDAVCLQEVDHFEFFAEHLAACGFSGMFQKKKESPCLRYNGREDGVALFWDNARWEAVARLDHNFGNNANQVMLGVHLAARSVTPGDVGVPPRVLLATTHLAAKKTVEGAETRRSQAAEIVPVLQKAAAAMQEAPIIFCGDLNAVPDEGALAELYPHLASAYGARRRAAAGDNDDLGALRAAEPAWTTWKRRGSHESKHTIDYIMYDPDALGCTGVLALPEDDEVDANRLPAFSLPSDHLLIGATFAVK